jgi:hypothetical protein
MIGYLVVGLLFVLIVTFTILSWKQWHWAFSVFLILSFMAGVAALAGAAKVFELRSTALREFDASEKLLDKNKSEYARALYGEEKSPTYSEKSLYRYEADYKLETTGRGRVWKNGAVDGGEGVRTFSFSGEANSAASDTSALKNTLLYAFKDADVELNVEGNAVVVPIATTFLGTVKVTNVLDKQLELTPVFVVDPAKIAEAGSWTLYEKMPGDRHETFVRANDLPKDMSITEYRALLTEKIFPATNLGMDPASEEYEAFIDQFAFDDRPIGEIRTWVDENAATRIKKTFTPAPEEEFVEVEFEKNASRPYRVDAPGNINNDGQFTILGEAIDKSLHLGKEVEFKKGNKVLVNRFAADGYQRADGTQIPPFEQGNVKITNTIYRRQLLDFPNLISDFRRQAEDYNKSSLAVDKTLEDSRVTLARAEEQQKIREELLFKLREDNKNLTGDLATISTLMETKKDELRGLQDRIEAIEQKLEVMQERVRNGAGAPQ